MSVVTAKGKYFDLLSFSAHTHLQSVSDGENLSSVTRSDKKLITNKKGAEQLETACHRLYFLLSFQVNLRSFFILLFFNKTHVIYQYFICLKPKVLFFPIQSLSVLFVRLFLGPLTFLFAIVSTLLSSLSFQYVGYTLYLFPPHPAISILLLTCDVSTFRSRPLMRLLGTCLSKMPLCCFPC